MRKYIPDLIIMFALAIAFCGGYVCHPVEPVAVMPLPDTVRVVDTVTVVKKIPIYKTTNIPVYVDTAGAVTVDTIIQSGAGSVRIYSASVIDSGLSVTLELVKIEKTVTITDTILINKPFPVPVEVNTHVSWYDHWYVGALATAAVVLAIKQIGN